MTLHLHDVQRVAHKLGLIIWKHANCLQISNAGTAKKIKIWEAADPVKAMAILQKIRRENHPLN